MEVKLIQLNVPVFAVNDSSPCWERVFGAVRINPATWAFPAYPPFVHSVLQDLPKVQPDIVFSEEAMAYVSSLPTPETVQHQATAHLSPSGIQCFEHQKKGLAELLYNWRWVLRWEMGTGKTKVAIEALTVLRQKALVICPLIAVDNWVREINMHSGGTLSTLTVTHPTKKGKLKQLREAWDYDIVITSYDTARLYAVPTLTAKMKELAKQRQIRLNPKVCDAVVRVADDAVADALFSDYVLGVKPETVIARAKEEPFNVFFKDLPYTVLILDESHRIKNFYSKRTAAILDLSSKAARRYLLTGTMSLGDPRDLYPQLRAAAHKYLCPEDYRTYSKKFCVFSEKNEHVVIGYRNLHVLNGRVNQISSECALEDCVDMPGIQDINIRFELSTKQIALYNDVVEGDIVEYMGEEIPITNSAIRLAKLLQVCSGFIYAPGKDPKELCDTCERMAECVTLGVQPLSNRCYKRGGYDETDMSRKALSLPDNNKLDTLEELLQDLLHDPTEKVILWANYIAELDDIEMMLEKNGWEFVRVDGDSTSSITTLADKFNTQPRCRVYLGQEATGIAINLVSAKYTVYYSRSWSLEHWLQSRARNYRIGQHRPVRVYRLCARDSIETQQLYALDKKQDVSKELTQKASCMTCSGYQHCQERGIQPWTPECKSHSRTATRHITRARVI